MPPSISLAVRARRALARPAVRRLIAGVLAVATGLAVASALAAAEVARDEWGETRRVAVATRDLQPGDTLAASDVAVRDLPVAVVPAAALGDPPLGVTVRQPIAAGEALVGDRLAPQGLSGVAALVPEGSRAVAVPAGPVARPPLAVGDLVDVLAVMPQSLAPAAEGGGRRAEEPAFPLVEGAPVVSVDEASTSVAIPHDDVARVAFVLTHGTVVLALAGP